MELNKEIEDLIKYGQVRYLPNLSVDCVIFGYHANHLNVLLSKWKGISLWTLPGGYVGRSESIEDAANRVLQERTGLTRLFLEQFFTFGDPLRVKFEKFPSAVPGLFTSNLFNTPNWTTDRFVSIGYYALVEYSRVDPKPDYLSDECQWWDIHTLPALIFDHNAMIRKALHAIRLQLKYQPVGYNLLPKKFTLPELQKLYETILDRKLDRRNFQKKMMALGILKRLDERKTIGPHRSPYLYSFDKRQYNKAMGEGYGFA